MKKGRKIRPKFIVIEGLDGSGKGTQTQLLVEALRATGEHVLVVDFPQYGKPSAALVEQYLNGAFGTAKDVTPYQASLLYAVDRFSASAEMKAHLKSGGTIVSNRYTTANQMHQAGKIRNTTKRSAFLKWLDILEYEILAIPRPDTVIFLDIPVSTSQKMVGTKETRAYLKSGTHDIHEKDVRHLQDARRTAHFVAKKYKWHTVACTTSDGVMRSREVIAQKIFETVRP